MQKVSHSVLSIRSKSKIIVLPQNFVSWRRTESSAEKVTFQKDRFSCFASTINKKFDFSYRWRNNALVVC